MSIKNNLPKIALTSILFISIFAFLPNNAIAITPSGSESLSEFKTSDYAQLAPLPDRNGNTPEHVTPIEYLQNLYYFILTISVILAVVMIIIAGVEYTAYGMSEEIKSDAKHRITYAIAGLLLALASWLILYIVNPKLVAGDLLLPSGNIISTKPSTGGGTTRNYGEWGDPNDPNFARDHLTTVSVGGIPITVNNIAKDKFTGFIDDLIASGYHPKRIDSYNNRDIAGTSSISNHAFGAAIDVDPDDNHTYPTSAGGPANTLPSNVSEIAARHDLVWGGDYHDSKDYMHFEIREAPASPDWAQI